MQINKIVNIVVDTGALKLKKPIITAAQISGTQISDTALRVLSKAHANIAKAGIELSGASAIGSSKHIAGLPEFLYHLTDETALNKILKSEIKLSDWEKAAGDNGFPGVYMIDKHNFLNTWIQKQDRARELVGEDLNLGGLLFSWMPKDNNPKIAAIQIPTSRLDMSKLRFRPYIEACFAAAGEGDKALATKGLPVEELAKWKSKNVPLEYIYTDTIPSDIINVVRKVDLDLPKTQDGFYETTRLFKDFDFVKAVSLKLFGKE